MGIIKKVLLFMQLLFIWQQYLKLTFPVFFPTPAHGGLHLISHSVMDRISGWDSGLRRQLPVLPISVTVILRMDVILAEKVAKRKVLVFYV